MFITEGSAVAVSGAPDDQEPYQYQHGFGNHHVSEAVPGALPRNGANLPQKCPYDLYPEHLNGTSFISSRETVSNVWMYRIQPGVVHRPLAALDRHKTIESCFLPSNANVSFTPLTHTWGPLPTCVGSDGGDGGTRGVTFVRGLRTIGGNGDATMREGLAVHVYAFDTDMRREAVVNHDGDFLIVPQRGALDIQTELGYLRVYPGDIAVVPAGLRFAVRIAQSGTVVRPRGAVGYVLEIFGTHFALPDLGPLGANGLAHVRDFEYPTAAFDADVLGAGEWDITAKVSGKLYGYAQPHTPFDVVAWHGRYAPFRYRLNRFVYLTANTDQLDPTAYCVLAAPSKWPGVSIVDFCVLGEKWAVAADTVRVPYYHRTMATEMCGVIHGQYQGSVRRLEPGGLSFEAAYMPHGETYEAWQRAADRGLGAEVVGRGFLGFMFHISVPVGLTRWAMETHPDIRPEKPGIWDSFCSGLHDKIAAAGATTSSPSCAKLPILEAQGSCSTPAKSHNGLLHAATAVE